MRRDSGDVQMICELHQSQQLWPHSPENQVISHKSPEHDVSGWIFCGFMKHFTMDRRGRDIPSVDRASRRAKLPRLDNNNGWLEWTPMLLSGP